MFALTLLVLLMVTAIPKVVEEGNKLQGRINAQSRVMDGVLARANCLLITTLWTVFKFVMVPIGARLAAIYRGILERLLLER